MVALSRLCRHVCENQGALVRPWKQCMYAGHVAAHFLSGVDCRSIRDKFSGKFARTRTQISSAERRSWRIKLHIIVVGGVINFVGVDTVLAIAFLTSVYISMKEQQGSR